MCVYILSYLSNYGPPLKESQVLNNVQIKTKNNRLIISFERSVKFLSSFSGNLYDLSECNNIVVGSGSHIFDGFFFHTNVPKFTDTCYKIASKPATNTQSQESSESLSTEEKVTRTTATPESTAPPATTTSARQPSSSDETNQKNSAPILPKRQTNFGLVRRHKFLVKMVILMQFLDDYNNNNTDAYKRLDETIRKYVN